MAYNFKSVLLASALVAAAGVASAQEISLREDADPTVSAGLTWVFGKGAAVGLKLFSTNREGDAAATLGIDYLFNSGAWRSNVGVAYIDNGVFFDLNLGFGNGEMDFGAGIGPIDSVSDCVGRECFRLDDFPGDSLDIN